MAPKEHSVSPSPSKSQSNESCDQTNSENHRSDPRCNAFAISFGWPAPRPHRSAPLSPPANCATNGPDQVLLCVHHLAKKKACDKDADFFVTLIQRDNRFQSAAAINNSLNHLYDLLARDCISAHRASTLAYISSLPSLNREHYSRLKRIGPACGCCRFVRLLEYIQKAGSVRNSSAKIFRDRLPHVG